MKHSPSVSLETIYTAAAGPVFMTGTQALVRLPMMQRLLDRHAGLNTAGLISGYRGSPLGIYDQQLWKAQKFLAEHDIVFQPGLNEDLAATALWGAQMHRAFGPTRVDGVFGIWYGKGNGVDRTADAFRNANMLGTSPLGGVLAIGGDDHAAQSSMFPHQTDGIFQAVNMPVLQPANVSEIVSLGLAGFALSRFSGLWVGMKTIAEVVESAASFEFPEAHPQFTAPRDAVPAHGLNWDPGIRWPEQRTELERRLLNERLPAAIAWARANRLDREILPNDNQRICIITVGKAHQETLQALENLGIDEAQARALGIAIYKVAMSWPLAAEPLVAFARNAREILILEEKNPTVENQIKAAMFNRGGHRPLIVGKTDEHGRPLLPVEMEFSPLILARVLCARLGPDNVIDLAQRLAALEQRSRETTAPPFPARRPFFCSGCPHNRSTKTPDGSLSGGGIGCHVMAIAQPSLKTSTFSQMGGEGMQWAGAAPFSKTRHIFQNLGDGTYQHSGLLAIRAAVAGGTNITFKILYNDAVAMTGGQPAEGVIDPAIMTHQLAAEGVTQIHLVSDDPDKWRQSCRLAEGVTIAHRNQLNAVQLRLREAPGVTAIVYEQTCAAEKRRRRKHNKFPDPARRVYINPRVCEGCGDCSVQSNCISVEPLETAFGRKRTINQSACNKDYSCINGFCPSFVDISGPVLRKPDGERLKALEASLFAGLADQPLATLKKPFNIYVAGIGGLGVLTVGAILGVAGHFDELNSTVLDFTGLAQKNGAVVSQVRFAPKHQPLHAVRIGDGEVDLLLGTDLVVSSTSDALAKLNANRANAVINLDLTPTADVVIDRDASLPADDMIAAVRSATEGRIFALKATELAERLFGNNVAANTLMLGYAWQKGLIPLSLAALRSAIQANGAQVELNLRAFDWGRLAAIDMARVEQIAGMAQAPVEHESFDDMVQRYERELAAYQDASYAAQYRALVRRAKQAADTLGPDGDAFVAAVARNAYKLMAYKDEYEVARLYTDPAFWDGLQAQFAKTGKVSVWLAPPILSRIDPMTGRPAKRKFGPWIFKVFALLAKGKRLRGTPFDPFGRTLERRQEREVRDEYTAMMTSQCTTLNRESLDRAIELAGLPDMIRGYGPMKEHALKAYAARREEILASRGKGALGKAA